MTVPLVGDAADDLQDLIEALRDIADLLALWRAGGRREGERAGGGGPYPEIPAVAKAFENIHTLLQDSRGENLRERYGAIAENLQSAVRAVEGAMAC